MTDAAGDRRIIIAKRYRKDSHLDSLWRGDGARWTTADVLRRLGTGAAAATSSMSAAWSRRITRCWCARRSNRSTHDLKLALIGDAPYADEYIRQVRDTRDPRVVMPGAIYGEGYHELQSHCFAYIHATEVGGTHPALIEAMGRGALTLYLNTPENAEVAGGAGIPFEPENLARSLEQVLRMTEDGARALAARATERVQNATVGKPLRMRMRDCCWACEDEADSNSELTLLG